MAAVERFCWNEVVGEFNWDHLVRGAPPRLPRRAAVAALLASATEGIRQGASA